MSGKQPSTSAAFIQNSLGCVPPVAITFMQVFHSNDDKPGMEGAGLQPILLSNSKEVMSNQLVTVRVGLGDTENVPCDNCNKRQCNYCGDIAVEYLLQ